MNLKKIFSDKKYGFYVSLATTVLALLTGIIYLACYAGTRDFNLASAIVMLVGFGLALILILINKVKVLPYVLGLFVLTSFLLYVDGIYLYVSEVMVGIDETSFSAQFIVSTLFFVLTLVGCIVNIFLPQVKCACCCGEHEEKDGCHCGCGCEEEAKHE